MATEGLDSGRTWFHCKLGHVLRSDLPLRTRVAAAIVPFCATAAQPWYDEWRGLTPRFGQP